MQFHVTIIKYENHLLVVFKHKACFFENLLCIMFLTIYVGI